ncbi:MAG: YHS domain-containing (seleno)protein [Pseudomonadota bacterium]
MKHIRTGIAGALLSATLFTSALAAGVDVNATSTGLAIRGYDPVAYFTVGAPTRGNWKITATHNGATYRFASKENKEKFLTDPAKFVPAYGGYCAFGTAMGFKFDGDPNVWKIVDNKLYLNLSTGIQTRWEGKVTEFITSANGNWKTIKDKAPAELQK